MRGSCAEMVRPSLLTSSGLLGTSGSWQISTSDLAFVGTSCHCRWGLRFFESVTCDLGSGAQNAYWAGIFLLLMKDLLLSLMNVSYGESRRIIYRPPGERAHSSANRAPPSATPPAPAPRCRSEQGCR